ncbi:hypothetical protein T07_5737 [Trichinella nelsoni]|uniref:Uncharacterized protein n=1 Tax=Trichinella nelsoni TaxID=6336 RepID=A0A0V0S3S3_9BILA|nr:hypothetical protein T07_5737 [Trichinella nelsoni]
MHLVQHMRDALEYRRLVAGFLFNFQNIYLLCGSDGAVFLTLYNLPGSNRDSVILPINDPRIRFDALTRSVSVGSDSSTCNAFQNNSLTIRTIRSQYPPVHGAHAVMYLHFMRSAFAMQYIPKSMDSLKTGSIAMTENINLCNDASPISNCCSIFSENTFYSKCPLDYLMPHSSSRNCSWGSLSKRQSPSRQTSDNCPAMYVTNLAATNAAISSNLGIVTRFIRVTRYFDITNLVVISLSAETVLDYTTAP